MCDAEEPKEVSHRLKGPVVGGDSDVHRVVSHLVALGFVETPCERPVVVRDLHEIRSERVNKVEVVGEVEEVERIKRSVDEVVGCAVESTIPRKKSLKHRLVHMPSL